MDKFFVDKEKKCLFDGCNEKVIKAHSIQNSFIIDQLAKDNHVYRLNVHNVSNKSIKFQRIGRRQASVFTGLCKKHDNIFQLIDFSGTNKISQKITNQQAVLFHFRALAKERWTKKVAQNNELTHSEFSQSIHQGATDEAYVFYQKHFKLEERRDSVAVKDMRKQFKACQTIISHKRNYHRIRFYHIIFNKPIKFAICSLFNPICDFNGNLINDHKKPHRRVHFMAINGFPDGEKSHLLFTWHPKYNNRTCSTLVDQIKDLEKQEIEKQEIELSKFMIAHCENILFNIDFIDSQTEEWKQNLIGVFRKTLVSHYFTLDSIEDINIF